MDLYKWPYSSLYKAPSILAIGNSTDSQHHMQLLTLDVRNIAFKKSWTKGWKHGVPNPKVHPNKQIKALWSSTA